MERPQEDPLTRPDQRCTDAMDIPRLGSAPKALLSALLGRTLVDGRLTSFRVDPSRMTTDLGWTPAHQDAAHDVFKSMP